MKRRARESLTWVTFLCGYTPNKQGGGDIYVDLVTREKMQGPIQTVTATKPDGSGVTTEYYIKGNAAVLMGSKADSSLSQYLDLPQIRARGNSGPTIR